MKVQHLEFQVQQIRGVYNTKIVQDTNTHGLCIPYTSSPMAMDHIDVMHQSTKTFKQHGKNQFQMKVEMNMMPYQCCMKTGNAAMLAIKCMPF